MAPLIFINFRRLDTRDTGPHLDTALQDEFGASNVFRDQRSIVKGSDFRDEIERQLRKCELLLAVMGPQWASLTDDATGRRLIDDPDDWVRKEIALALSWKLEILPVLVGTDEMPQPHELPADLRDLAYRQAVDFRPHKQSIDLPPLFEAIREKVPDLRRRTNRGKAGGHDGAGGTSFTVDRIDRTTMVFGGEGHQITTDNSASGPEDHDEDRP
ncbi:toll/interleukin-1 receptor domain-containing protein [Streptomyces sp. NPDC057877]|uniref:toll/interleukin-1 receptor domain-containing protein n=1 Tax=Streptomyces sp. NPDC057877 TaxID=3346269 RepID=UPI003692FCF8